MLPSYKPQSIDLHSKSIVRFLYENNAGIEWVKTLTISKIVHLALVKVIAKTIILQHKIKNYFIWKNGNPKIKQATLCKDYENGGLKNVDITFKIISLQCSWAIGLYDSSTYDWKLIPLHIITQKFGIHFLFRYNLYINQKKIRQFPKYYQEILSKWSSNLSVPPETSSTTATAHKMKFSIKDFFSKCDQIRSFLRIWSHLLRKSLMENFIFCAVSFTNYLIK